MKDKERLLSFNENISFIFSHSALKEGWDNPNIFQICTLRDTKSQMKKRQEVGRGLRLPVNQNGDRVYNSKLNILTIIPNESYKSFCEIYQKELDELCYNDKIRPADAKKENIIVNRNNKVLESVDSKKSHALINNKTKYFFEIKTNELVKNCINMLNKLEVQNIQIEVSGGELNVRQGVNSFEIINKNINSIGAVLNKKIKINDFITRVAKETFITKKTIFNIFSQSNTRNHLYKNYEVYVRELIKIINKEKAKLLIL